MIKSRRITAFSLSFLDIMACGFGAVTLLFLILRHSIIVEVQPDPKMRAEVVMLTEDVKNAEEEKTLLLNSIKEMELKLVTVQGLSKRWCCATARSRHFNSTRMCRCLRPAGRVRRSASGSTNSN